MMRFSSIVILMFAAVVLAVSGAARADTIQYSTSGYFGASPASGYVSAGSESLSFAGLSNVVVNTPSTVSFGAFTPAFGAAGSSGAFTGDLFTLVISQINSSTTTSQQITGTVTGSLTVSAAGAPSSNVFVNFGSQSVSFTENNGNIATYTPFSTPVGTEITTLQGVVNSNPPAVTPIPSSALAAGGLLGLIALRQIVRRFFSGGKSPVLAVA